MSTGYNRTDTTNNIATGNIINASDLDAEYDAIDAAFDETTGHDHGGASGNGAPITKVGPVQDLVVSASTVTPKTTNTLDLGTPLLKFKDLNLAGNALIAGTLGVTGVTTLGAGAILNTPASVTLTNATGLPISSGVAGLGTGVATALAVNIGSAGAPVLFNGALGTPSSGTVTNLTGTASININGTVGATTANTGAFTNLSYTGTLTGGTGVVNLGSGQFYKDASGNVGIGTATFIYSTAGRGLLELSGSSTSLLALKRNNLASAYFQANSTALEIVNTEATPIRFLTSSTERMRIDSSGNLLVGTTTADNKLTISSSSAGAASGVLSLVNPNDTTNTAVDLDFVTHSSGTLATGRIRTLVAGSDNYPMSFWTYGSGGIAERMRIDSSGNVGIGTSSPQGILHVQGASSQLLLNYLGSNSYLDSDNIIFRSYASASYPERMRIDSSGNVGIGTSSPSKLLDVNGDALISGLTVGKGGGTTTGNTAFGVNALFSSTTSNGNIAIGHNALYANTTGQSNTAIGSYDGTTASALRVNTTGSFNIAVGTGALNANTTASRNTAVGYQAAYSGTTSEFNSVLGYQALYTGGGGQDTAVGYQAGYSANIASAYATYIGFRAGYSTTTGIQNTAIGNSALFSNTTASSNTAVGYQAGYSNTTGASNTCVGEFAGYNIGTGQLNTYIGSKAGGNSTASSGQRNIGIGDRALGAISTGSNNIGIGFTDSVNGYAPVFDPATESNRIVLGTVAVTNAYIKVAWTVTSDARDKTNIVDLDKGLDFVSQLQPKAYQFKTNRNDETASGNVRYGFLAQDILALEGDSPVIIDNEDLDHLKYNGESLVPILVKAIQELKAEVDSLKQQLGK